MRTNKLVLKYIELSNLKGNLLDKIKDLSTAELNHKFSESEWCITQVIDHLVESETGINKYINFRHKNINEQPSVGLTNYIKSKVLNKKLKSEEKFKVPSGLSQPEAGADFEQLKEKWDDSRMFLIKTVETFPKDKMNKAVFMHPRAGLLSMNHTMSFFINHLKHHIPQVDSLLLRLENQK